MTELTDRYGRLVAGIAQGVIVAAILYVAITLTTLLSSVAVLQTQVQAIQNQIAGVYTQRDATRDLKPIRAELADHEQRIRALEQR